jgi:hypothetical protein
MKRYLINGINRALLAVSFSSDKAPPTTRVPYQNSPMQAVGSLPQPSDILDFSQNDYDATFALLHEKAVIKTVAMMQPAFVPSAPKTGIAQMTNGVVDQRLMSAYPVNAARNSYNFGKMFAPARLQSVPGYIVKQTTTNRSSVGYPTQALRAPKSRTSGGGCVDD